MRALVIDDERLARNELKRLLENFPKIEVIGEAANADEALQLIDDLQPELLFLDIQMPGKTGFELLEFLSISSQEVIYFISLFSLLLFQLYFYYSLTFL